MKIGIIGVGFVGGTTKEVLNSKHEIYPYDRYKGPFNSEESLRKLTENSEVVFVCVPTPMKPSGEIDNSAIYHSLDLLNSELEKIKKDPKEILVVIRSTTVSGTTDKLAEKYTFSIAVNPEFLREKHALEDMKNTSRVIIGANTKEDYQKIHDIYSPIFPNAKYIFVDRKTSEMIKYASNVILTGQISLANEINQICSALGVNYDVVKNAILLDERIGRNIDVPGPDGDFGFGGKCFPKDLNALIHLARENEYRPYLLEEIWRLNERVRKNKDWLNISGEMFANKQFDKENLN